MAAQPNPPGAVSDGWSLLNVLRTEAHRRQSRGAAGPVRRAGGGGCGGGGGSGAAAAGGVERRVDGVRHASVDRSPLFCRYLPYGTTTFRKDFRLLEARCNSRSRGCGYVGKSERAESCPHIHQPSLWVVVIKSG